MLYRAINGRDLRAPIMYPIHCTVVTETKTQLDSSMMRCWAIYKDFDVRSRYIGQVYIHRLCEMQLLTYVLEAFFWHQSFTGNYFVVNRRKCKLIYQNVIYPRDEWVTAIVIASCLWCDWIAPQTQILISAVRLSFLPNKQQVKLQSV